MYDNPQKHSPHYLLIGFLYIFTFSIFVRPAFAECVPNQSEVPVCLSGTAISQDYSGALIEETGRPGTRPILPGDAVDDWTVGEIGAGYVVLKHGLRTVRLEMPHDVASTPEVEPDAEPSAMVKKGPVRHTRSLARGGS